MRYLLLLLLTLTLLVPARAQAQTTQFLTAQGAQLVYKGETIVLKGTNYDNISSLGAGIGTNDVNDIAFSEADYAELARQGANHVRLGLSFSWYDRQRADFYRHMDQQVGWARQHGIFLVFNMFTTPGDCYEGYGNSCPFWTNSGEQQRLQSFWVDMATRYRHEPAVAGYDLLNEPTPGSAPWCARWWTIAGGIYSAIRAVNQNQLIFMNTCSDPLGDLQSSNLPRGPQIVYEVHDYFPISLTHNFTVPSRGYPGTASEWFGSCTVNKAVMAGTSTNCVIDGINYGDIRQQYGLNWAAAQNVPIYIGEWGATRKLAGGTQFLTDKADLYRQWGVHHAHYTWKHQTIVTGGFYQWGLYSDNPSQTDDPAGLAAVKIAFAGAIRPDFGQGPAPTPQPTPQPPAGTTATSTVPPSATAIPQTTETPSVGPPTAIARTPNATQLVRTATVSARQTLQTNRTATAAARTATLVPTPAVEDLLAVTIEADRIEIVLLEPGGVLISTVPDAPAGVALPFGCDRQGMSVWCWGAKPGILRLPYTAQHVYARQGSSWGVAP